MTSTLPPFIQAFSGAIGSATANSLTYPLDLLTTQVQLQSRAVHTHSERRSRAYSAVEDGTHLVAKIVRKDGVGALYDGIWADVGATLLSNFFYFYFYSFLRTTVISRAHTTANANGTGKQRPVKLSMIQELFLGFIAGVASRAISSPLNIITLRLQTERSTEDDDADTDSDTDTTTKTETKSSLPTAASSLAPTGFIAVINRIYTDSGLAGFWKGFTTSTILSLNPSITLTFFQLFRRLLLLTRRSPTGKRGELPNPTPREAFIGGAISNSIAVAILYPLILAKTRLQAEKRAQSSPSSASSSTTPTPTLPSVLSDAYHGHVPSDPTRVREAGLRGLYQGLQIQILKGFLRQGVTFLVKGRIEQLIVREYLRRRRVR